MTTTGEGVRRCCYLPILYPLLSSSPLLLFLIRAAFVRLFLSLHLFVSI